MTKQIFLAFWLSFLPLFLFSQSTMPVCGGSARNGESGSVSYTVGQVDYQYGTSPSGNFVAGVQQPFDETSSSFQTSCDGVDLIIYPNPTSENLYIACDVLDADYPFLLTDLNGKILAESRLTGESTTIPMTQFIDGAYLLKIICGEDKDDNTTFKIIKKK